MKNYKIAVLGPIPRDHITTHEGLVVEKYGCVLYPVVALSKLATPDSQIIPVTHVQRQDAEPIKKALAPFKNVKTHLINSDQNRGDVISLKYVNQNQRLERQTAFMAPIVPKDVAGILDADAFVPVTDFEVALDTLKFIKEKSKGVVIFDGHGPTNSCTRQGERVHRFWIDRDQWLPYIDILKMNLEEAACSWFNHAYTEEELEENEDHELSMDELPKFATYCLDHGVKAVYVTLDEYGCAVYFKNDNGDVEEFFVKRIRVENVVDTTGCGDSFAGGLAFGFLKTNDYVKACYYGNAMGAQRCTGTELGIYKSLEETEKQIVATYGEI